ncbi:MAG TPA: Dabb family protein [bacterium]|nr:Dabb family protein [bacterium]
MFRHVVMWELMAKANEKSRQENVREMKRRLEALPAVIPQIQDYEVGINAGGSSAAMDIVLISSFRNTEEFEIYRQHPAHQEVLEFIRSVQSMARVVDYQQ